MPSGKKAKRLSLLLLLGAVAGCAYISRKTASSGTTGGNPTPTPSNPGIVPATPTAPAQTILDQGIVSFYGPGFNGRKTANGEIFNEEAMTAAHKTLKFGTVVDVIDLDSGNSVRVRINDRGPFVAGRVLDLSVGAARKLGILQKGLAKNARVVAATTANV